MRLRGLNHRDTKAPRKPLPEETDGLAPEVFAAAFVVLSAPLIVALTFSPDFSPR
jgi:hypothetical protein